MSSCELAPPRLEWEKSFRVIRNCVFIFSCHPFQQNTQNRLPSANGVICKTDDADDWYMWKPEVKSLSQRHFLDSRGIMTFHTSHNAQNTKTKIRNTGILVYRRNQLCRLVFNGALIMLTKTAREKMAPKTKLVSFRKQRTL